MSLSMLRRSFPSFRGESENDAMQITVHNDFQFAGGADINSFLADEQTAINILQSTFTDNISVVFDVGFGSYRGAALQNQLISEADVNSAAVFTLTYSQLRQDLLTFGQPGFFNAANLPAGNSLNNQTNFWISSSVGAIFGLFTNDVDGFVGIGNQFAAGGERISAFLPEMGHAMGRVPENFIFKGITYFSALDLVRFINPGVRLFDGSNPNHTPAYFSLDGGATKIADWGQNSDVSDFLGPTSNPPSNLTPNDPFDENVGTLGHLTTADILVTEALGFKTVPPAPPGNPPPPPGTTADMVLRHGADGKYEIYDIGGNSLLAAYQLGQVGTDWRFVTLAGFFGNDTTDMLLRNANTGGFEVYDIVNNNITRAGFLGNVGLDWQVMGFGNFSSFGETDMMLRNVNNGGVIVYDIRNNQITAANFMGSVGLDWQVAGFGNFSSRGTSDMILRNVNSGALLVYNINSNQITGATFMGAVGPDWKVLAFGNFSGSPGETDMIMRNANTGAMVIYDIAGDQVTSAFFIGSVGLNWQFAGVAPVHSPGASDLVLRNVNTGQFEVYDIAANTLIGAASLGTVGLDWQLGGLAVDPPIDDANVGQLVQAMAGLGDGSGAADGLNAGVVNADASQQTFLTTPQHS
jgi:hypothetical protein